MIQHGGGNDILRLQATAVRDGVEFDLACIGDAFAVGRKKLFERDYMRLLLGSVTLAQWMPAAGFRDDGCSVRHPASEPRARQGLTDGKSRYRFRPFLT
jgi:hypothetical protein